MNVIWKLTNETRDFSVSIIVNPKFNVYWYCIRHNHDHNTRLTHLDDYNDNINLGWEVYENTLSHMEQHK